MNQPADFRLETRDQVQTAVLTGDWTAVRMGFANELLGATLKGTRDIAIDANGIDRCDTSGAYGILKAVEQGAKSTHARKSCGCWNWLRTPLLRRGRRS
jgi:anti-anti-sigma regulatory factor